MPLSKFKLGGKKAPINVLSYRVINFFWVTKLSPDTTDLRKDTSFSLKYAVAPSGTNGSEIVVLIKLCDSQYI